MRITRKFAAAIAATIAVGGITLGMRQATPIRVLLLTGQMNRSHDWRATTPVLEKILAEAGLFQVTTVTVTDDQVPTFSADWSRYQVVVLNYDGVDWPAATKTAFEAYMRNGGGMVSVHAADNSFPAWPAYNEMIGIGGWRGRNEACGPLWYYRGNELVSDNTPGRAGTHPGDQLPFKVTNRNPSHPITAGLPATWLHNHDELYASLRGPGRNLTPLASGESNPETRRAGTGRDELQLMALSFGQGRVFHTTWGHDVEAMASVDFITTLQRGVEWAATGRVAQPVPDNFPTADAVSYRWDILRMDPAYARPAVPAAVPATAPAPGANAPTPGAAAPPAGAQGGRPPVPTVSGCVASAG